MKSLYQHLAGESVSATLLRLENEIKSSPADADLRAAYVQFLCLSGNWSRVPEHLKSWQALKPQAMPTVTLLEQNLKGEQQRIDVMSGRARPQMQEHQWPWLATLVSALAEPAEVARQQRVSAFEMADASSGELNLPDAPSQSFSWLMDGDARLGPVCEVIVRGDYYWLPFSAISEIQFQAPASVTDLVWRHALVKLTDGSEQICQIPARYPITPEDEERFMLGRETEWQPLDEDGAQYQGQGQKIWFSDSDEIPVLSLDVVSFA